MLLLKWGLNIAGINIVIQSILFDVFYFVGAVAADVSWGTFIFGYLLEKLLILCHYVVFAQGEQLLQR